MTRHILEPVEFKHLLYGRRDAVATITINRPDNRNALGTDTVKELRQAFDQAKHDEAVRVIVLTGAGKVFCAGADLQGFRLEISELDRYFQRRNLADLFLEMTELGKPTIARVNGHALAGGFGLVAACDLAIASDGAQFGMPEVNVGVWPMMIMAIVLRGTLRKTIAMIIIGHTPTLTSGIPNWASSEAIARSQAATRPKPPASACPLTRAMVGFPNSVISWNRSARLRRWK